MKRLVLAFIAAVALLGGAGVALAQSHGGSHGGGGSWHGGTGWHGGGWHHHRFHHHRFHSTFFIGFPSFYGYYPYSYYYPYYDGYPYYYPTAPVYYDQGPTTYIQQDRGASSTSREGDYSYYCTDPAGYYPQIQNCARGWLKVVPGGSPSPR